MLIHRGMTLWRWSGFRRTLGRCPRAGMSAAHSHRLAAEHNPVLAFAFQRVLDIHVRVASLQSKFHLRRGLIAVNRDLLDLAIHHRKIQVRAPIQTLFDAGADRILIVRRFAASASQYEHNYAR